jgi:diamine N-acetyltransferase
MTVTLRSVTPDNFRATIRLWTSEAQQAAYEAFAAASHADNVAANVFSLAEAQVHADAEPRAIYADEEIVGFIMAAPDKHEDKTGYYIWRLMVDYRQQRKGYGRAALQGMMDDLATREDCQFFSISVVNTNADALKLYESLGFVQTGEMDEDEIVLRRMLDK